IGMAVLPPVRGGTELAGDQIAFGDELPERSFNRWCGKAPSPHHVGGDEWDMRARPSAKKRRQWLAARIQINVRQADRDRDSKRFAIPPRVVGCDPPRLAGDSNGDRPPLALECVQPLGGDAAIRRLVLSKVT